LSVAKYMSDRILVMSKGQIVESGTPEQLYLSPKEEYTRTLINAIPKGEVEDILQAQQKRELMKAGQL